MTETTTRVEAIERLRRVLKLSSDVTEEHVLDDAADRLEKMNEPKPPKRPETHGRQTPLNHQPDMRSPVLSPAEIPGGEVNR